jgi:YesN/AraC family two-component response regulator
MSGPPPALRTPALSSFHILVSYRFDIIIADISLPDGDGRQLVRDALAHNPAARAILISGFMYRGLMIPHDLYGKVELLAKPFIEEELSGLLIANCSASR